MGKLTICIGENKDADQLVGPVRKPHCCFSHEAAHMTRRLYSLRKEMFVQQTKQRPPLPRFTCIVLQCLVRDIISKHSKYLFSLICESLVADYKLS